MSMVFDGVIVAASPGRVEQALEQIHSHLDLTFRAIASGVLAVYLRTDNASFSPEGVSCATASPPGCRLGRTLSAPARGASSLHPGRKHRGESSVRGR
jgi:hypothetical protein